MGSELAVIKKAVGLETKPTTAARPACSDTPVRAPARTVAVSDWQCASRRRAPQPLPEPTLAIRTPPLIFSILKAIADDLTVALARSRTFDVIAHNCICSDGDDPRPIARIIFAGAPCCGHAGDRVRHPSLSRDRTRGDLSTPWPGWIAAIKEYAQASPERSGTRSSLTLPNAQAAYFSQLESFIDGL